jgi:hypothetical protein
MQKAITKVTGFGIIPVVIVIVVVAVVVLVIVDTVSTPPPAPQNSCALKHNILLPDKCVCSTAGGQCTATSTRPYLFIFKQDATCPTLGCDVDLRAAPVGR